LNARKQSHPRRRSKFSRWLHVVNQNPGALTNKLGILGTRRGAITAIGWIVGIAVTPWLRWFVAGSLLLGLLFATAFQYIHNRETAPPDILKPED
jgi:hypothetical protein